jgi:hypothetical protein
MAQSAIISIFEIRTFSQKGISKSSIAKMTRAGIESWISLTSKPLLYIIERPRLITDPFTPPASTISSHRLKLQSGQR